MALKNDFEILQEILQYKKHKAVFELLKSSETRIIRNINNKF